MVTLQIRSLELGYRYLLSEVDTIELWTQDHMLIAEFSGFLLLQLVLHHLSTANIAARLRESLEAGEATRLPVFPLVSLSGLPPVPDVRQPLRKVAPPEPRAVGGPERAALRLARRARKR